MTEGSNLRLAIFGVVILSLFSSLFARLWYLQMIDSEEFVRAAESNQVKLVFEEAPRGRILDRHGRVLVENRLFEVVTVDRQVIKEHPDVVNRLAAVLDLAPAELQGRIDDPRASAVGPVAVAEDIPEATIVYLREHRDEFPGVEERKLSRRVYPNGPLGAHVLGYVGEANQGELDQRRICSLELLGRVTAGEVDCYLAGDSIGKTGVEQAYEKELRGQPSVTKLEVDSRGRVVRALGTKEAVNGHDVQLTIDLDLQRLAEDSLVKALEKARTDVDREQRKHFLAPAGAAVVLDPRDGGVVAMASYPTYDPAEFVNGISRERFEQLQDPAGHFPLNNRAVQGQYAPGSTFKLVTALAALGRGVIQPGTTYDDGGVYRIPRCRGEKCVFQNAGRRAWGRVNLARSLTVSSDVYYYWLGDLFWRNRTAHPNAIQEMAKEFGIGEKLGFELGDRRGFIPTPETRATRNADNPKAFPEGRWFTGDNLNLAIGQGEMVVTPLQLASAYATFGNGGTLYRPRVGAKVLTPTGAVLSEIEPDVIRTISIDAGARAAITSGLRGVTSAGDGTAAGAFSGFPTSAFPVAGKTGTAQVARKQDTALFAAFAPADAPQFAIAVVLEEAGFGGSVAAPVARRILDGALGRPVGDVALVGATE